MMDEYTAWCDEESNDKEDAITSSISPPEAWRIMVGEQGNRSPPRPPPPEACRIIVGEQGNRSLPRLPPPEACRIMVGKQSSWSCKGERLRGGESLFSPRRLLV